MAPNTCCILFPICHLCVLFMHNLKTTGPYTDVLHIKQLLYYQKHSLCGLELHEKSDWRAIASDTHRCPNIHVYIAIGVQLSMTTELTYLVTTHYTPNDGFTVNVASFYKNKVGYLNYMLQCLFY